AKSPLSKLAKYSRLASNTSLTIFDIKTLTVKIKTHFSRSSDVTLKSNDSVTGVTAILDIQETLILKVVVSGCHSMYLAQ
ncbi:MAG: hypothetical protein WCI06_07150, partial [Methylococcaceae bacterium]